MIYNYHNSNKTLSYDTKTKKCLLLEKNDCRVRTKSTELDLEFKSIHHFIKFCNKSSRFNNENKHQFVIDIRGEKIESDGLNDYSLQQVGNISFLSNIRTDNIKLQSIDEEFSIIVTEFNGDLIIEGCNITSIQIIKSTVNLNLYDLKPIKLILGESTLTGELWNNVDLILLNNNNIKYVKFNSDVIEMNEAGYSNNLFSDCSFNCALKPSKESFIKYDAFNKESYFIGASLATCWFVNCTFSSVLSDYRFVQCVFIKSSFLSSIISCWFQRCLFSDCDISCNFADNVVIDCGDVDSIIAKDTFEL
jgi:hypothetical protein